MKTEIRTSALFLLKMLVWVGGCWAVCSCSEKNEDPPAPPVALVPTVLQSGQDATGFRLYSQLALKAQDGNLLYSPLSTQMTLGLLLNATPDQARLAQAMGAEGYSTEAINQANRLLTERLLEYDKNVTLSLAQAVWGHKDLSIEPAYSRTVQHYYQAPTANTDLYAQEGMETINRWANEHTKGQIEQLYEQAPEKSFVMANALYFRGLWQTPFDAAATQTKPFKNADGSLSNVPAMHTTLTARITDTERFQVLELPYGTSGSFSLLLFRPKTEGDTAPLTETEYKQATDESNTAQHLTALQLPKFSIQGKNNLLEALQALRIIPKEGGMDLSKFTGKDEPLELDSRQHITFSTDEAGTTAAATTLTEGIFIDILPEKTFSIDRHFQFVVHYRPSLLPLFIGRVNSL